MGGGGDDSQAKAEIKAAQDRARRLQGIKAINEVFGRGQSKAADLNALALRKSYSDVRKDVSRFFKEKLNRQNKEASRELGFELARRGQIGGSVQVDQQGELRRLRDEALLEIANKGVAASNATRSANQAARLNAIRDISADVNAGSVRSSAIEGLKNSAANAYSEAVGNDVGRFFGDLVFLYGVNQSRLGEEDARRRYFTGGGQPSISSPNTGRVRR